VKIKEIKKKLRERMMFTIDILGRRFVARVIIVSSSSSSSCAVSVLSEEVRICCVLMYSLKKLTTKRKKSAHERERITIHRIYIRKYLYLHSIYNYIVFIFT